MTTRRTIRVSLAVVACSAAAAHAEPAAGPDKRFYVRAGVTHVAPQAESGEVVLSDVMGLASLAIDNGPIAGSGATITSATVPAAIVGVVLPVLDRSLSVETVLGLPFTVRFRATGTLADQSLAPMVLGLPTGIPPLGPELGEAKAAPAVITLLYRPRLGRVRPFGGAGLGILFAYDAKITNPVLTEVAEPTMSISRAAGLVLQGGVEARVWRSLYARLDLKYIAFMKASATIEDIQVAIDVPLVDSVAVGTATTAVTINPLIVQAGVGIDF